MDKPFDQKEYIKEWSKQNMKQVKVSYKAEFVDEFKNACKKLGLTQSEVFKKTMQDIIEQSKKS